MILLELSDFKVRIFKISKIHISIMGGAFTKIDHKSSSINHVNFRVIQGQQILRRPQKY
jgi:hypothetical protein